VTGVSGPLPGTRYTSSTWLVRAALALGDRCRSPHRDGAGMHTAYSTSTISPPRKPWTQLLLASASPISMLLFGALPDGAVLSMMQGERIPFSVLTLGDEADRSFRGWNKDLTAKFGDPSCSFFNVIH
jgi:hypothetical protein